MIIGSIGQRIKQRKTPNYSTNNYFNPNVGRNPRQEYGQNPNMPPEVKPNERIHQLETLQHKKDKNKYIIGETKEEIIDNIINEAPTIANVRKALTVYAEIITDEEIF